MQENNKNRPMLSTGSSRGCFITLEGGDGSGKSTHVDWLAGELRSMGIDLVQTREPGGTELGEEIRRLLLATDQKHLSHMAELMLVFAARAQHVEEVILPALTAGRWVLCERFTDATYAYQGGGRNLPFGDITYLENMLPAGVQVDLTLFFSLPPELSINRKERWAQLDRFEQEALSFHERAQEVYQARAKAYPDRIKTIAAELDVESVRAQIQDILLNLPMFTDY